MTSVAWVCRNLFLMTNMEGASDIITGDSFSCNSRWRHQSSADVFIKSKCLKQRKKILKSTFSVLDEKFILNVFVVFLLVMFTLSSRWRQRPAERTVSAAAFISTDERSEKNRQKRVSCWFLQLCVEITQL